jgi:hypothetical protein
MKYALWIYVLYSKFKEPLILKSWGFVKNKMKCRTAGAERCNSCCQSKSAGFYLYCSVFEYKVFLLRVAINQWITTLSSTNHAWHKGTRNYSQNYKPSFGYPLLSEVLWAHKFGSHTQIFPDSYYSLDTRVCVCCVCVGLYERDRELVIRTPLRTHQVIMWYISRFMIDYSTLQKFVHHRLWA